MFNRTIMYAKLAWVYAKGICGFRRKVYDLKFVQRTDLKGYFECVKQYSGLFAGATYKVNGLEGFTREIWICPVTLTVLGHYPQYIYIKQMTINN